VKDEDTVNKPESDIGHEIGEHNIEVMGLDIHNPVFIVSAVLAVSVVLGTLLFLEQAAVLSNAAAAVVVGEVGTAAVTPRELEMAIEVGYPRGNPS